MKEKLQKLMCFVGLHDREVMQSYVGKTIYEYGHRVLFVTWRCRRVGCKARGDW